MNKHNLRIASAFAAAALLLTSFSTISRADSAPSDAIPAGVEVATLDHSYNSASRSNNLRELQYDDGVNARPTSGIEKMPVRGAAATSGAVINGTILYHTGGPVLTSVNIYTIWYGSSANYANSCAPTPTPLSDAAVLNPFLGSVGASSWYGINTRYYSKTGSATNFVTNTANYPSANCTFVDSSTYGTSLEGAASSFTTAASVLKAAITITLTSTAGLTVGRPISGTGIAASTVITNVNTGTNVITLSLATTASIASAKKLTVAAPSTQMIVDNVIRAGTFAADSAGLYFVLTDSSVKVTGFGTSFCGYHGFFKPTSGVVPTVQYSFVGNPSLYMGGCAGQSVASPNGNPPADAMASVVAHELVEAVSDPQLNAWFDSAGNENADKCAWVYGATTTSGGASSNIVVGSANYLIQQNWDPILNGCYSAPAALPALGATVTTPTVNLLAGTAANVTPVTGTGGSGGYTYAIAPALANGLIFNTTTGAITGTPTAALVTPLSEVVTVSAATGGSVNSAPVTINVKPAFITALPVSTIVFTHGVVATSTVAQAVTGGYGGYTYSLKSPPAGVTINASSGLISFSGSATIVAAKNYTLTVTDSAKFSKTYSISIRIA